MGYIDKHYDITKVKEVEITINPMLYDNWRYDMKRIATMSESKAEAILAKYISISVKYDGIEKHDLTPTSHEIVVEDENVQRGHQPITIKGRDLHVISDFGYGT
jgi:predicted transcriptional regulator